MEFLRSPRAFEVAVGFEEALDGLPAPVDCVFPKKSIPINDSCGCRRGLLSAGGAMVRAGFVEGRSAVFGRAGGSRSPKRSMLGAGRA
jgi:hypothetical protein